MCYWCRPTAANKLLTRLGLNRDKNWLLVLHVRVGRPIRIAYTYRQAYTYRPYVYIRRPTSVSVTHITVITVIMVNTMMWSNDFYQLTAVNRFWIFISSLTHHVKLWESLQENQDPPSNTTLSRLSLIQSRWRRGLAFQTQYMRLWFCGRGLTAGIHSDKKNVFAYLWVHITLLVLVAYHVWCCMHEKHLQNIAFGQVIFFSNLKGRPLDTVHRMFRVVGWKMQ